MIDFVRIYFDDKERIDRFVRDGRRSTIQRPSRDGEKVTYIYWWHNLKFVSTDKKTYVEGSLHSFNNAINGVTSKKKGFKWVNDNLFTMQNLFEVVELLEKTLKYDLSETRLTICELGLNINIDERPKDFIDKRILMYKLRYPCYDPKYKEEMKIKKFELNNYCLKIYDKSLQYGRSDNILRFEVGYRTDELREVGITSVRDLLDVDLLDNLFYKLLRIYSDLLIVDKFDGNELMCEEEREMMILYTNPQFWVEMLMRKDYNGRSEHKKQFEKLVRDCALDSKDKYLRQRLIEEYNSAKWN